MCMINDVTDFARVESTTIRWPSLNAFVIDRWPWRAILHHKEAGSTRESAAGSQESARQERSGIPAHATCTRLRTLGPEGRAALGASPLSRLREGGKTTPASLTLDLCARRRSRGDRQGSTTNRERRDRASPRAHGIVESPERASCQIHRLIIVCTQAQVAVYAADVSRRN